MEVTVKRLEHGSAEYEATVALRYRILRAPLGLSFTAEQLAAEATDTHIAAYAGNQLLGCLVLTPHSPTLWQMRQVAVEPDWQAQGIGTRMVAYSEQVARENGVEILMLHARETAVAFYLRLGYEIVGEPFEEVTIPHRALQKSLSS